MNTVICGCGHLAVDHFHQTDSCRHYDCVCEEFIADPTEWSKAKLHWAYELSRDEDMLAETYAQEELERDDNGPESGSTDLGNSGGTTFCY